MKSGSVRMLLLTTLSGILLLPTPAGLAQNAPALKREPGAPAVADRRKVLNEQLVAVNRQIASLEGDIKAKDTALASIAQKQRELQDAMQKSRMETAMAINKSIMQLLIGVGAPRARQMPALSFPSEAELKALSSDAARRQTVTQATDRAVAQAEAGRRDLASVNGDQRTTLQRLYAERDRLRAELRARQ